MHDRGEALHGLIRRILVGQEDHPGAKSRQGLGIRTRVRRHRDIAAISMLAQVLHEHPIGLKIGHGADDPLHTSQGQAKGQLRIFRVAIVGFDPALPRRANDLRVEVNHGYANSQRAKPRGDVSSESTHADHDRIEDTRFRFIAFTMRNGSFEEAKPRREAVMERMGVENEIGRQADGDKTDERDQSHGLRRDARATPPAHRGSVRTR